MKKERLSTSLKVGDAENLGSESPLSRALSISKHTLRGGVNFPTWEYMEERT